MPKLDPSGSRPPIPRRLRTAGKNQNVRPQKFPWGHSPSRLGNGPPRRPEKLADGPSLAIVAEKKGQPASTPSAGQSSGGVQSTCKIRRDQRCSECKVNFEALGRAAGASQAQVYGTERQGTSDPGRCCFIPGGPLCRIASPLLVAVTSPRRRKDGPSTWAVNGPQGT